MDDTIAEKIKCTLSKTDWKVSRLERIAGGNANFTYRGYLESGNGTIVIKHSEPFAALNADYQLDVGRSDYEWFMLSTLSPKPPARTDSFLVRSPKALGSFEHTKLIEDLPNSTTVKAYLSKYGADLQSEVASELGTAIGRWLSWFHGWIDGDDEEAVAVRNKIQHNPMAGPREYLYIGSYRDSMAQFPTEVDWPSDEQMGRIEKAVRAMYQRREGGIHGDFWTGNMILPDRAPAKENRSREGEVDKIFILDFEVSQLGSRSQDLAQCLAELWMVYHFYEAQAPLHVMRGFISGYAAGQDEQFALQIAMHFGIHIVVISWRYGWPKGDKLVECVRFGNSCLVKGFEGDVDWFKATSLRFLFSS
ncbi:uncharacterized protein PV09_06809 [Verruconis gallopava]|uniref:Uncharacterized protein n=1 Tax=Verruconis gallopava TaxID=253628 RepID=A0A0D2AS23_9PEZI|nr:uncharacterized protein PV09_06809 [Verruconis gallopava]KIW01974.1 hypothetical protein PV09_06809 [Verruconis gallopava]